MAEIRLRRETTDDGDDDDDSRGNIHLAVCIDERGSRLMDKSYSNVLIVSCKGFRLMRLHKGLAKTSTLDSN